MKLYQIWNAVPAWQKVSGLDKKPRLAYELMMYGKQAEVHLQVIEQRKEQLVYEVSGLPPGSPVTLEAGTTACDAFWPKFNEFLQEEATLAPLSMTLGELVDSLSAEGNLISEDDLELLEPFFTKPQA